MINYRLNINGTEVKGLPGQTILEVAKQNSIEIPTLCYDERVKIYGACGLCVVEVEGNPKLVRACATEISQGMVVMTDTERVRGSRQLALELLLSDHVGDCRAPCREACPAKTDCQGYVGLIANGNFREALELIKEQLPLPACIGRVCPHPCEEACRRQLIEEPVSIAWIKRFAADQDLESGDKFIPEIAPETGKRIAIIGAGPCGLSAAYFLAMAGHSVEILEAMPQAGGMLRYGIPEYRLPKDIVDQEIDTIEEMGVQIRTNIRVGKDVSLEYLRNNYDAVYIAIGAWASTSLGCSGEELEGVFGGIDFLKDVTLNKNVGLGKKVVVIGGGNTAMDACRTAKRMGADEVTLLYRRSRAEMPAEEIEIVEAEEEGVIFRFLTAPLEIIGNEGKVTGIMVQQMELGEPDASGRRKPVPIAGSENVIPVDSVIQAIGQYVIPEGMDGVKLTRKNTIAADTDTFSTNLPGVFAGGDAINEGPGIAIAAIGHAKKAADIICSYLDGKVIPYTEPYIVKRTDVTEETFADRPKVYRSHMGHKAPSDRKSNFSEVVYGYSPEQAIHDSKRCLECGCGDVFECKLLKLANDYNVNPSRIAGEVNNRKVNENHPFIVRNPDKCILCGLCVRICDEVMGIGAFGLVNRGFDTVVQPEFGLSLCETGCISCGQCVSACPTGALQEKLTISKPVPVTTIDTPSVCSFCSVGCNLSLKTNGELLVKAVPIKESPVDNGLLCVKGRFGSDIAQKNDRILNPMVRKGGILVETDWQDAFLTTVKSMQSLISMNGGDSAAVSVSGRYTNEDIFSAVKLAKNTLGTKNIFSFDGFDGGIKKVLGYDASSSTFDELLSTEVIFLVCEDIMQSHPIVGLKIKTAVENGAKLILMSPCISQADEWAQNKICPDDDLMFLKGILKSLISTCQAPSESKVAGFAQLAESLSDINPDQRAIAFASIFGKAKKAMIVFDQSFITPDAACLLADIAVVSGHIGKPRSGIIQLKPKANSQGLSDLGAGSGRESVQRGINSGEIKGLMIFGEDPAGVDLSKLSFLAVQDTYLTATAQLADVVFPGVSFAESYGSYTSSERRIQALNQAIPALTGMDNGEVISALTQAFNSKEDYCCAECTFEEIGRSIPEYFAIDPEDESQSFWPSSKSRVLYEKKFNFEDGKAKLAIVDDGPLFADRTNSDYLENTFTALLKEQKLI